MFTFTWFLCSLQALSLLLVDGDGMCYAQINLLWISRRSCHSPTDCCCEFLSSYLRTKIEKTNLQNNRFCWIECTFFGFKGRKKNVKIVWKIFFRITFPWIPWGIMWMLCHGNEKSFWRERFREMKSFLLKLSKALFCDEFVKVRDYKSFKWWWPSVDFWVVKNNPVLWCYGTKDFHLGRPSYC